MIEHEHDEFDIMLKRMRRRMEELFTYPTTAPEYNTAEELWRWWSRWARLIARLPLHCLDVRAQTFPKN